MSKKNRPALPVGCLIRNLPRDERGAAAAEFVGGRVTVTADPHRLASRRETVTGTAVAVASVWGSGHGGGHVLVLATDEGRVWAFPLTIVHRIDPA